jgi:hypothetical protein
MSLVVRDAGFVARLAPSSCQPAHPIERLMDFAGASHMLPERYSNVIAVPYPALNNNVFRFGASDTFSEGTRPDLPSRSQWRFVKVDAARKRCSTRRASPIDTGRGRSDSGCSAR